jgi:lysozyme
VTLFARLLDWYTGRGKAPVAPPIPKPVIAPAPIRVVSGIPQFSEAGTALLQQCEGFRAVPYDDRTGLPVTPGGVIAGTLTVGYGHTGSNVIAGQAWTEPQALHQLSNDLAPLVMGLSRIITANLTDNEFSALVCLAYNVGFTALANSALNGGTLYAVNLGTFGMVPGHIASWNKAGGVILPGLVGRRAAEVKLWNLESGAPIPDFAAIRDAASEEFSTKGTMSWL